MLGQGLTFLGGPDTAERALDYVVPTVARLRFRWVDLSASWAVHSMNLVAERSLGRPSTPLVSFDVERTIRDRIHIDLVSPINAVKLVGARQRQLGPSHPPQIAGLIREVESAGEIVRRIAGEAEALLIAGPKRRAIG